MCLSPHLPNVTFLLFLNEILSCWKTRTPCRWFVFCEGFSLAFPLSPRCAVTVAPALATTLLSVGEGMRWGHALLLVPPTLHCWSRAMVGFLLHFSEQGLTEQVFNHHSTVKSVHHP